VKNPSRLPAAPAPQLGWQGMLAGYGVTQSRDLLGGLFDQIIICYQMA
jgi:hypothetical protein